MTIGDIAVQFVGSTGKGGQRIGRSVALVLAAPKSKDMVTSRNVSIS